MQWQRAKSLQVQLYVLKDASKMDPVFSGEFLPLLQGQRMQMDRRTIVEFNICKTVCSAGKCSRTIDLRSQPPRWRCRKLRPDWKLRTSWLLLRLRCGRTVGHRDARFYRPYTLKHME